MVVWEAVAHGGDAEDAGVHLGEEMGGDGELEEEGRAGGGVKLHEEGHVVATQAINEVVLVFFFVLLLLLVDDIAIMFVLVVEEIGEGGAQPILRPPP